MTNPDDPTQVDVTIDKHTVTYHFRRTSAPKAYDGFGTFTVYEYDAGEKYKDQSFRVVAIRAEHLNWQTARYSSGCFASPWPEDWQRDDLVLALWKRLQGKENE
jgi:hypothetical protein